MDEHHLPQGAAFVSDEQLEAEMAALRAKEEEARRKKETAPPRPRPLRPTA